MTSLRRVAAMTAAGLMLGAGGFGLLSPVLRVAALSYTVDETADEPLALSSSPVCLTASAHCSLRAAIQASNNAGGSNAITLPAGEYDLSASLGELQVGPSGGMSITIDGAGAATTVINAVQPGSCAPASPASCFRVFDVDPNVDGGVGFSASGVTISGGRTGEIGGAAILNGTATAAQADDTTTLSNCVVTDNVTYDGSGGPVPGGGLVQTYGSAGITNCTFSNNTASRVGGAVDMEAPANGGTPTLSIAGSTFTGNTATIGGGVSIANTVSATISSSTFTTNTSTGNGGAAVGVNSGSLGLTDVTMTGNEADGTGDGGAVYTGGGSTTIQYSRIYDNTAGAGHAAQVFNNVAGATTSAENDWWGVNTGPGSGIANFSVTAWQVLRSTAWPRAIAIDHTATITATLDTTNLGGSIAPANHLPDGIPVAFADGSLGSVSPAGATLTAGSATTTYTAGGTPGADSVPTTVDAQTVSASILVSPVSAIATRDTTCAQFAGDTAASAAQMMYSARQGAIRTVSRAGFFYWVTVTSSGGPQSFTITQTPTEASNRFLVLNGAAHTAGCSGIPTTVQQSQDGSVTLTFNGRRAGATIFIGVKFSTSNVVHEPVPTPNTTVVYEFGTNGVGDATRPLTLSQR